MDILIYVLAVCLKALASALIF